MTTASSDRPVRRRRYERADIDRPCTLTPAKLDILRAVGTLGIVSLPQLARMVGLPEKATRRHARALFDSRFLAVTPVSRIALAEPHETNDASLLFGSAPNLYSITQQGIRALAQRGEDGFKVPASRYGPRNSYFLAHTLAVVDTRIWLERAAARYPRHQLDRWKAGGEAEIDLKQARPPQAVRPDAVFVYQLGSKALVGLVEVDMGSERGLTRWQAKLAAYKLLYSGDRLRQTFGFSNARVLVITPTPHRRDALCQLIREQAAAELAVRFWISDRSTLFEDDLSLAAWRQPASELVRPLLSKEIIDAN